MSCFAVPGGPSAGLTLTSLSPARTSVPLPSAPLLATCVSFTLGRTSSRRLLPLVKKGASLQVAAGLYPAAHFCPTRLNTSDAPTRHRELPAPCPASLLSGLPAESLYRLSCLGGLSRASSGWLRLVLLYAELRGASPRVSLIKALTLKSRDCLPLSPACGCAEPAAGGNALEFDQTLGYPGEGPLLAPRNKWDLARAAARGGSLRPVLDRTQKNRKELLQAFGVWLGSVGTSLSDLLDARPLDAETVAGFLTF